MNYDVIVVGGGAAGFFAAINCAEKRPDLRVAILERGSTCLEKVRISGGGRCNVTHGEFVPRSLATNYPRGEKELLGPFHTFMSGDTMAWFEERNVPLKIEDDSRVFPTSNSSETIINCFEDQARILGVEILIKHSLKAISKKTQWHLETSNGDFTADQIVMATGSNPKIWKLLQSVGHSFVDPVPSLFTFNCKDERIAGLPGLNTHAEVALLNEKGGFLKTKRNKRADRGGSQGPLLITHWGFSGPAILKLSAWAARALKEENYQFTIKVNWLPDLAEEDVLENLQNLKFENPKQQLTTTSAFNLPKRLWQSLVLASTPEGRRWADSTKDELKALAGNLTSSYFTINGKSTFKEEFVTAGGINLKEVNFKSFESKKVQSLYFAGEILNIDAITGGFNFQNAWTGAYIVAQAIAEDAKYANSNLF